MGQPPGREAEEKFSLGPIVNNYYSERGTPHPCRAADQSLSSSSAIVGAQAGDPFEPSPVNKGVEHRTCLSNIPGDYYSNCIVVVGVQ